MSCLFKRSLSILIVALTCLLGPQSFASVVINGTRVIYQGDKKEVTVTLTNNNKTPVLIQNWIDTGDENAKPGNIAVPFVLTPPINRVDPGKGQTLRISYLGAPALPSDKESVFWLNVLEVPAKSKNMDEEQSRLNIAFRSRIKLFYRPAGLTGDALQAPNLLQWKINGNGVSVTNPTPYHVSLTTVRYKKHEASGIMIAPGATQHYSFKDISAIDSLGQVSYSAINDYGGLVDYQVKAN